MKKLLKKIFKKENDVQAELVDPPGRTFKRVLTSEYFHHADRDADCKMHQSSKECKISQITEHELMPMYVRYLYEGDSPISAHVAFQKEVFAEKWNMIHITEVSFNVNASDFSEFETMAKVTLENDFRDVTPKASVEYEGEDRRKKNRS
ncbi:MAG: hypothetical protein GQ531_05755 [Sulfurovum sp.]|nr:hypothetical protein [Sulfurovum sp.]